jgi:RNA 2',3'-cyclic 3'-phosphodiesterase
MKALHPGKDERSVRVFIAIPLPTDLKANLVALQQEFQPLPLAAAWVREAGLHVTVKFLGDVDSTQLKPIISCMTTIAQHCHPFSLSLAGVGVFPHESSPRVLWVGVQDASGDLQRMQQALDAQLMQLGFPSENRPFAPHLTLARLKRILRRGDFLAALKLHRETVLGQLHVGHIELVESRLHPSGARYSTVHTAHFLRPAATSEGG